MKETIDKAIAGEVFVKLASAATNKLFHFALARAALADRREAKQKLVLFPKKRQKRSFFKKSECAVK